MEQLFITDIEIKKVRHLKDISIPLSEDKMKHLILTGKNGSGKTSVVEAFAGYLNNVITDRHFEQWKTSMDTEEKQRDLVVEQGEDEAEVFKMEKEVSRRKEQLEKSRNGLDIQFNKKAGDITALTEKYHYILAYYKADRIFEAEQPRHVEKVQLKDKYGLTEFPRNELVKYLLALKMTEA